MRKSLGIVGFVVAVSGSLALSRPSSPQGTNSNEATATERARGDERTTPDSVAASAADSGSVADAQGTEAVAPRALDVSELGLVLDEVPSELAAHLELEPGEGLLVTEVLRDSPAERAGLERYDVLFGIDRDDLAGTLFGPLEAAGGVALEVIRGGVEHTVAVLTEEPGAAAGDFLSYDSLPADHPFRRLSAYRDLRERYSGRAKSFTELVRDVDERTREAQEAARSAVGELLEGENERVAGYLGVHEEDLLGRLASGLAPERTEGFGELALDPEELAPEGRRTALRDRLSELDAKLTSASTEFLATSARMEDGEDGDEGDEVDHEAARKQHERAMRRTNEVAKEAAIRVRDRLLRPWESVEQELERHRERLGPKQAERAAWVASQVAAIQTELEKRVTCAVERTRDECSNKLRRKLDRMEAPLPGELEAALADIVGQMEAMTTRFLVRTENALARYEEELDEANARLVPVMEAGLDTCEGSLATIAARFDAAIAAAAPEDAPLDGSWQATQRTNVRLDALRAALWSAVSDGRDDLRPGTTGITVGLQEHRVASEDAWNDLRELLGEIRKEATNDCWKLDGPHLDGRFPKGKPRPEKEPKKEVAMARN